MCCARSAVSDSGFGIQKDGSVGSTATALMTTLYFGLPLAGYHQTDGEQYDEQADKVCITWRLAPPGLPLPPSPASL